ncbi:hypothetical protein MLD38_009868 [Melastoma candidum]|uniref:Uncharacterized protein n=1 Tax=Melastoma candidum TaxID=119954 RepID=A0ACB9S0V1_9MYRT|nr:hypothetical protein MLD38_009868 [Melastoma candidum]
MSASVSLTAAVARRKPVLVSDVRSHSSAAADVPPSTPSSAAPAAVIETATSSKDIGRYSSRNNEPSAVRKAPGDGPAATAARRARKLTPRKERPWWLTAISVFTKNFVLLMVVIGLVQLVRKMAVKSVLMPPELTDFEGRITEVEGLVKKTAKTLQVQMDVVDKKVGSEVLGLREEVKEIRESAGKLGDEVKELVEKSGVLERGLKELRDGEWLSKEEFQVFVDEVKAIRKDRGHPMVDVSLDDLKAYAREMLIKEIEKHAADGLGMVDYAVASAGGSVIGHSEVYSVGNGWFSMTTRQGAHADATKMLKPSFGEPGQCFPLKGSSGYVIIKLRTSIIPEAVTLEHVAKSVAFDRSSAPKDCRVSGWLQGRSDIAAVDATKMLLLTEFAYDLDKSNAQTFDVDSSVGLINRVRLDFSSNHGSPSHTCIYRFRVHGHEPDSNSLLEMQS